MDVCPLLGFDEFTVNSHTGQAIARYLKTLLATANLTIEDSITLPTLDGAGNNKKAFKILKKRMKVCAPHNLQRSIQYGLGRAGKRKNLSIQALIERNARQSKGFNTSVKHSLRLQKAQTSRGIQKRKTKRVFQQHAIRWGGLYRMLRQNRKLESDIKLALTGSRDGVCEESAAFVTAASTHTAATPIEVGTQNDDVDVSDGEDPVHDEDFDSDADQVEANENEGKEYPLQHRCLPAADWKKNNQFESVLTTAYDVSEALQSHSGCGLDKEFILASFLYADLTGDVVEVVSGAHATETWSPVHATALPADLRQFRTVAAEQIKERLLVLEMETLLALKMNPSIDTTEEGVIFKDKSGSLELMNAQYNRQLRHRGNVLLQTGQIGKGVPSGRKEGCASQPASRSEGARLSESQSAASGQATPTPKRRKTLEALANAFTTGPSVADTSVAPVDASVLLDTLITAEKESFVSACKAAVTSGKYLDPKSQEFNQLAFYCDNQALFPIHCTVFRSDCGPNKAASANVEQVFSGAGALLADFHRHGLSPKMLALYMFIRTNWQYEWMRPSVEDILQAYKFKYGDSVVEEPDSDSDSDSDNSDAA
ncbi:hypothetical protein CYMTET_27015 [Cymbomonas tetramitiformis]|uniref:Uncharacterized protein n=1 Tax=Cymbomonas tetramitiformis TaxID=36881 RepID=A0AAE0FR86_9CHLO|nr:hypothetical protein CYMTET_27015 [Cymbomonas tetramitiformis]